MLSVALFTSDADSAYCIDQLIEESNQFSLVIRGTPIPSVTELFQALKRFDPEVILLDLSEWNTSEKDDVAGIARHIHASDLRGIVIGFRKPWNRTEQAEFEDAGVMNLLAQPFSSMDLEKTAYEALHRDIPLTNPNILAFLPAKAGGGCSVVTVNTAAAIASQLHQRVLLLEADRRSGALGIMLDLEGHHGQPRALKHAASMTAVAWQEQYVEAFGMHVLLAEPGHRGPYPGWADYYQLLRFVQDRYDFVFVDLPEIVNEASAEVVRSARGVFLVCTPELPSLQMARHRCTELEEYEVPRDRVHIILNRQERGSLPLRDIEKALDRPVFATLPNDYKHVRDAIVESRLVATSSPFGEACKVLARKVSGVPKSSRMAATFGMLTKLRKLAS